MWSEIEFLLICDSWQDEEHPEVDAEQQDDLEDDLSHHRLPEVEGPVHHHGSKLDQDHDQERPRHLILRQRWRDVRGWVFLQQISTNYDTAAMILSLQEIKNHFNLNLNEKRTPNAQNPNTMMMKSTVSARNISTYTSVTALYSGWIKLWKNCLMGR